MLPRSCPKVMQTNIHTKLFFIFRRMTQWCRSITPLVITRLNQVLVMSQDNRPGSNEGGQLGSNVWKALWKLKIPAKMVIFAWKLLHNGIAVRSELARRNIQVEITCLICTQEVETIDHLLFRCDFIRGAWFASCLLLRILDSN